MKRMTAAVLILLVTASFAVAQWDVEEDFSNGIPQGWTSQGDDWVWIQNGPAFATPYVSSGGGNGFLVSAPYDVSAANHVVFTAQFNAGVIEGYAAIEYGFSPNGPWTEIMTTTDEYLITRGIADHYFTADDLTGDDLYFRFRHEIGPDGGVTFSIDNFRLSGHIPGWLSIDVTPLENIIPANGGVMRYSMTIRNTMDRPLWHVRMKTFLQEPYGGGMVGPLTEMVFNFPENGLLYIPTMNQTVPGGFNGGTGNLYVYLGYGTHEDLRVMDWAPFIKEGPLPLNEFPAMHPTVTAASDDQAAVPGEFALLNAYPNPFNAATTIAVQLPESAELRVNLFNSSGQQVADLAAGSFAAGTHEFSFNGEQLASGIYFVRASVPGKLEATRKIVLMK